MKSLVSSVKETYSGEKRLLLTAAVIAFGINIYQIFPGSMISIFFTDIVHLSPGLTSFVEIFRNLFIALLAPFLGLMLDRFALGGRRYSSWFLLAGIITAVSGFFLFAIPAFIEDRSLFVVGLVLLCFMLTSLARNIIPLNARYILKDLSKDPKERAVYEKNKSIFKELGKFVINIVFPLIIAFCTPKIGEGKAYFVTFLFVMTVYLLIIFWVSKEIRKYMPADLCTPLSIEQNSSPKKTRKKRQAKLILKTVFANKALFVLFFGTVFVVGRTMLTTPLTPYYFKYVVGDFSKMSVCTGLITPVTIVVLLLLPAFINLCRDTKRAVTIAAFLSGLTMVLMKFAGAHWVMFTVLQVSGMAFISVFNASIIVMFMNAADWGEWKYGVASHALIAGIFGLTTKVASTICAAYRGVALEAIGFVGGMEPTSAIITGIPNIMGNYGFVVCLGALLFLLVPLSDKQMQEIKVDLEKRKQS